MSRLQAGVLKGADDVYFPRDTAGALSRMKYGDLDEVEVGRMSLVDRTLYLALPKKRIKRRVGYFNSGCVLPCPQTNQDSFVWEDIEQWQQEGNFLPWWVG